MSFSAASNEEGNTKVEGEDEDEDGRGGGAVKTICQHLVLSSHSSTGMRRGWVLQEQK